MRPQVPPQIGYGPGQRPAPRRPGTDDQAAIPPTRPGRPGPSADRGNTGGAGQHQQAEAVSRSITDPDPQAQAPAVTTWARVLHGSRRH
jgi:hypothetical protein